jgi:iduronate 2-sulfatase
MGWDPFDKDSLNSVISRSWRCFAMKKPVHLNRREFMKLSAGAGAAGLLGGCNFFQSKEKQAARPNILFVIVDDLRPELGCYGCTEIKTPNFDRFARGAVTFTRAFCQAAACAPSRASVLLGQRPETNGVRTLGESFREINPDCVTMPQHFHKFGYHTVSIGKIFHNHMPDPVSFDEPDLRPAEYATAGMIDRDPESFYYDEELKAELARVRERRLARNPNAYAGGWAYGRSWEASDAPDDAFYDGAQTTLALKKLGELKDRDQPFYLALGYYRPHLPFVAPKKYWDLYDREKLSPADNPYLPENSPSMAMNSCYELKACYDLEWVEHPAREKLPEETARLLKHGYYASVSYVDACFGRLMDGLEEMGLAEDTIVVVWGDHGWKLGEHGSWCKQTNYNIDTRVPLWIRVPGRYASGRECGQLAELVDLFPTLCDLAGIDIPGDMEGISLAPMLKDPDRALKSAAFSQYHQRPRSTLDGKRYMGYSMVTERYHYVEWHTWDNDRKLKGELAAVELYDNRADPAENVSIADYPENGELVRTLSQKLKAGWQAARLQR